MEHPASVHIAKIKAAVLDTSEQTLLQQLLKNRLRVKLAWSPVTAMLDPSVGGKYPYFDAWLLLRAEAYKADCVERTLTFVAFQWRRYRGIHGNLPSASEFRPNRIEVVELIGVPGGFEPSFAP